MVITLKKFLMQFGSIILVMVMLSITMTQVRAQGIVQQSIPTGSQAGVLGTVTINNIDSNAQVEISCQIGSSSIGSIGIPTLVQRSFGPGTRQYWCPFGRAFPGPDYYWVILSVVITEPCGVVRCGGSSYTLIDTSSAVHIA